MIYAFQVQCTGFPVQAIIHEDRSLEFVPYDDQDFDLDEEISAVELGEESSPCVDLALDWEDDILEALILHVVPGWIIDQVVLERARETNVEFQYYHHRCILGVSAADYATRLHDKIDEMLDVLGLLGQKFDASASLRSHIVVRDLRGLYPRIHGSHTRNMSGFTRLMLTDMIDPILALHGRMDEVSARQYSTEKRHIMIEHIDQLLSVKSRFEAMNIDEVCSPVADVWQTQTRIRSRDRENLINMILDLLRTVPSTRL